jgi:hypothetical protein
MYALPLVVVPAVAAGVGYAIAKQAPEAFDGGWEYRTPMPIDQVWAEIHDPVNHPMSARQAPVVTLLPDVAGLPSWKEDLGESVVTVVVTETAPDHEVRTLQDSVVPVHATWRIDVTTDGDRTVVKVHQTGTIVGGGFAGDVFRAVMWAGGATTGPKEWLRALDPLHW